MAETSRDRNRRHLDAGLALLGQALLRLLKYEARRRYGAGWPEYAAEVLRHARRPSLIVESDGAPDLSNLLFVMGDTRTWQDLFDRGPLGRSRPLIWELQQARNRDAHIHAYSNADTYRDLDTITRVLTAMGADEAGPVGILKQEVLLDLGQAERDKVAGKRQEILSYLTERVFGPVLQSSTAPPDVRKRVGESRDALEKMTSAKDIRDFYWNAIQNSADLPKRMKQYGFTRFEEIMEEFRDRFSDDWLLRG